MKAGNIFNEWKDSKTEADVPAEFIADVMGRIRQYERCRKRRFSLRGVEDVFNWLLLAGPVVRVSVIGIGVIIAMVRFVMTFSMAVGTGVIN